MMFFVVLVFDKSGITIHLYFVNVINGHGLMRSDSFRDAWNNFQIVTTDYRIVTIDSIMEENCFKFYLV